MSWSVARQGRAAAVKAALRDDFSKINCDSPEQETAQHVAAAIDRALSGFPAAFPVKVLACGSQSRLYSEADTGMMTNQLSVSIEPLHNFLE